MRTIKMNNAIPTFEEKNRPVIPATPIKLPRHGSA